MLMSLLRTGVKLGSRYNPQINYKWRTLPVAADGLRYIADSGKSPKYDLALHSGQGVKFNGVDQTATMPVNATVNTIAYMKNGILVFDEILQDVVDYVTDINSSSIYGNFIFYAGLFTQTQKHYLLNNPEKFLYKDGVLKSDILTQSEIDNVVAWYPMCETDNFVRDVVNYSKSNINIIPQTSWTVTSGITLSGTTVTFDGTQGNYTSCARYIDQELGMYVVTVNIVSISDLAQAGIRFGHAAWKTFSNFGITSLGVHKILLEATETRPYVRIWAKNGVTGDVHLFEKRKVTGVCQINNYTNDCKTLAKQLPYGLQTSLIDTDVLGVPIGKGDYLSLKGTERPALPINLTDTELWGNGTGFVIEFIIERGVVAINTMLLSSVSGTTGMYITTSEDWAGNRVAMYLYDGTTNVDRSTTIGGNASHIIFEVTPANIRVVQDGIVSASIAHSFVPSGLNFKDSTELAAKGSLHSFKMWFGDNYSKYDRAKSVEDGQKLI